MNIGIARPGYFTFAGKAKPSTETNWIYYDLLSAELCAMGHSITTIGFKQSYGADRTLRFVSPFGLEKSVKYTTQTQQAVTESILSECNDGLLDGLDVLLMPYYSHLDNRCKYFTLAWLCAEYGVPLVIWDTDANFIAEVSLGMVHVSLSEAITKIFTKDAYISDELDMSIISSLNARILSPAIRIPNYATYFPFFSKTSIREIYDDSSKMYDLVYAGSEYGRSERLLKYYASDEYKVSLVGKFSKHFAQTFPYFDYVYDGHISQWDVPNYINTGVACVQIARNIYEKIGHITPRVFEVVYAGTLLLMDDNIYGADQVVGPEYIVNSQEDVINWLDKSPKRLMEHCNAQATSPYIQRTAEDAAKHFMEIVESMI